MTTTEPRSRRRAGDPVSGSLVASGTIALFTAVFVLLALRMQMGLDPALQNPSGAASTNTYADAADAYGAGAFEDASPYDDDAGSYDGDGFRYSSPARPATRAS